MRVLVACEFSGVVSQAFRDRGHDAISADFLENELTGGRFHYQGDVLDILDQDWDLLIAHPPCTYLCNSGVRWLWNKDGEKNEERWSELAEARAFFMRLWTSKIPKKCIENPIPHKYAELPKYSQVIQPWMFGHPESKATCLWLEGLPLLQPTEIVPKEKVHQRIWRLPPGPDRWKERSRTYEGIARAMAEQWG